MEKSKEFRALFGAWMQKIYHALLPGAFLPTTTDTPHAASSEWGMFDINQDFDDVEQDAEDTVSLPHTPLPAISMLPQAGGDPSMTVGNMSTQSQTVQHANATAQPSHVLMQDRLPSLAALT